MKNTGLYVHIPFCVRKCDYCDFYSLPARADALSDYCREVSRRISALAADGVSADTLYFGGGTPSLVGGERIADMVGAAAPILADRAEITVEVNPAGFETGFFGKAADSGVNRVSIGLQSANGDELKMLTRRHTADDAAAAVALAKKAGIGNISLDIMLGIQGQTKESLKRTVDFCAELDITHISAYLLKLEPGTPYFSRRESLLLPDEDAQAELYLFACEYLNSLGYKRYEISNFAKPGFESKHNLKYWRCEEYIGIGPSAHSFFRGRRFFCPRDLDAFMNGCEPTDDGMGGDLDEYIMLRLRLSEGLDFADTARKFPDDTARIALIEKRARELPPELVTLSRAKVSLTDSGCLVSNSIIAHLLK